MNSSAPAIWAARRTSVSLASGRPRRMFSSTRGVEEHRLLEHERDLLAQRGERRAGDVGAVEEHAPAARREEARDQVGERRLARAGGPDERDHLADARLEVDRPRSASLPSG